jgi:short-subunit dehydrogenase
MKNNFQGKTVIVTGASSGIGRETALAFAEAGANVVLAARRLDALEKIVDEHPAWRERMLIVRTDVTQDNDVARLVERTIAEYGRIDILVNNAGIGLRALVADSRPEDARRLMELNFFGALRCIQAVLPHMRQQGRGQIVNIGSVVSAIATPRNGIYSASKFALRALSDALRMELHGTGIEVIFIMPSYTDTPFFDNQIRYSGPARISPIKGQHPSKVARAILNACRCHKREVTLTVSGRIGVWMKRFAPRLLDFALRRAPRP